MENKEQVRREEQKTTQCVESPTIEVIELVCQNTPDWTHGSIIIPV